MVINFKHCIVGLVTIVALNTYAQQTKVNKAIVTIIGDPAQSNPNPSAENNIPAQQQATHPNQTIEPTLENGFHMRFEVNSNQYVAHGGSLSGSSNSSNSSSGSTSGKIKKHSTTMKERCFNLKKRIRTWLPERKKKYSPHLCSRF
jgi:hypothetical protein